MFMSPCALERSLRFLCVQSVRGTGVLQPALNLAAWVSPESEGAAPKGLWYL